MMPHCIWQGEKEYKVHWSGLPINSCFQIELKVICTVVKFSLWMPDSNLMSDIKLEEGSL